MTMTDVEMAAEGVQETVETAKGDHETRIATADDEGGDTASTSSQDSAASSCCCQEEQDDSNDIECPSSSLGTQQDGPTPTPTSYYYPKEFYCPLTNELFQDPVVAPDGESYEREAYLQIKNDEEESKLYPNRALKMIMDETILLYQQTDESFQASFKRLHHMAKKAVSDFFLDPPALSTTSSTEEEEDSDDGTRPPLSDGFYCPITFNLIHDPVIDPDGNSFEKVAVENWIVLHGTSPVTRNVLTAEALYPNHSIRRLLEQEVGKPEDQMHPDIKKWKTEPAPKASDLELGGMLLVEASTRAQQEAVSSSSPATRTSNRSAAAMEYQRYRRRMARRQICYNMAGLCICILMIRFMPRLQ